MRSMLLAVFLAAMLHLASAQVQQETLRVTGQVRFVASSGDEVVSHVSWSEPVSLRKEPPKGVTLPAWANASCRYGTFRLGKPAQEWHLMVEVGGSRAVVDVNRNNDLRDDEVLRVTPDVNSYSAMVYGPFRLTVPLQGVPAARYFSLVVDDWNRTWLYLRSEDYRVFEGDVDGRPFQMAVLDNNSDGAFDSPGKSGRDGDTCLFPPETEMRPLPRYHRIGDRWYRMKVAPDGSECELQPSQLSMGTVVADYPHVQLHAIGKEVGYWEARTEAGRLQMPIDEYSVVSYAFGARDSQGNQWEVRISPMDALPLKVKGGEGRLLLPTDLTATLAFGSRQGDTLNVSLVLHAGGTTSRVSSLRRNGQFPPPPTLRVIDRNGKTVKLEKFEYG